jgi:glycosyltransferase involved in cell wall biosynthesis
MKKIAKTPGEPVSVLLDASPLLLRSAGVKNYVYYWARSLAEHAGANRLKLFPFLEQTDRFAHETSVMSPFATLSRLGLLYAANLSPVRFLDWVAPRSDIFHASHQVWNPPRKTRMTATIYDVTCWLMPEVHAPANVKAADRIADCVFRPASGLIAISECTRADAVRVLGLAREKIEVIYPGIAPAFFSAKAEAGRETAERYGLTKPYALYVGSIEPRKNVGNLLDAWQGLSRDLREQFDLVVVGPWGWGDRTVYDRLRAGIEGVRYLGYIPEEDLPGITAAAELFVYVSLYEGFGLPVGQAMAAGVPVLASMASSLPEVVGDAGLLADPRSREEIRVGIERLLLSPSLRAELGARARKRAGAFTWEECARESWRFFEKMAG